MIKEIFTFSVKAVLAIPATIGVLLLFGCVICFIPILTPFLCWVSREISTLTMFYMYLVEAFCWTALYIYYNISDEPEDLIFFAITEILAAIFIIGIYFRLFT